MAYDLVIRGGAYVGHSALQEYAQRFQGGEIEIIKASRGFPTDPV